MLRLEIRDRTEGDVTVLDLAGDLVFGKECQKLAEVIRGLADQGRTHVLLNLEELRYIDSSGVGELVASFSTLKKLGGELKVAAPTDMVRKVLQLVKLENVLEIHPQVADALQGFDGGAPP